MTPERHHRLITILMPAACLWAISGLLCMNLVSYPFIFIIQMFAPVLFLFDSALVGEFFAVSAVIVCAVLVLLPLSIARPQSRVLFVFAHIAHTAYWLLALLVIGIGA